MSTVRGRVLAVDGNAVSLYVPAEDRVVERPFTATPPNPGDLVSLSPTGHLQIVVPTRADDPTRTLRRIQDPRRRHGMATRDALERGIRAFFDADHFREVRTPVLVGKNATEAHITPISTTRRGDLQTSPELAMKRLLVGGLERIWQIATVFRDEPDAITHRAEFSLLEWYRAYANLDDIMNDVESLVSSLAARLLGKLELPGGVDVAPPWPRYPVRELFATHAGVDLATADLAAECRRLGIADAPSDDWDARYFRIWLTHVEPRLPRRACFVTRYPASQAALAVTTLDPDGTRWAQRFEVYAGGLELANAFEELTDVDEQRRRFTEAAAASGLPVDESFLAALAEGMPPSGGIALGVDRLAMLFAGEPDIDFVRWF
jgi:lysyl-tRNA synthetase class 2